METAKIVRPITGSGVVPNFETFWFYSITISVGAIVVPALIKKVKKKLRR